MVKPPPSYAIFTATAKHSARCIGVSLAAGDTIHRIASRFKRAGSTMPTIELRSVSPALRAIDIKALAEWYRDALGFEILFLYGNPTSYAMVRRGGVTLAIARKDATFGPISGYVEIKGVDAIYAEFRSRGVQTSRPPTVADYGMKDFDLTDPDGNRLCFGESTEDCEPAKK